MKLAKKKRVQIDGDVPIFDNMLLSSASINNVNASYKRTLNQTQQKMMLLDQSIDSLLYTRRLREEKKKSKWVTFSSVDKEIEEYEKEKKKKGKL